jgi:hypothetical protein
MSFNHPKAGANSVPAYQMSGIPFVTSSATSEVPRGDNASPTPIQVDFPFVTKNVKVRNIGAGSLRVSFSALGGITPGQGTKGASLTSNYFLIPPKDDAGNAGSDNSIVDFDVRCKSIFFTAEGATTGFSLFAGLTRIDKSQFPVLTGSVTSFEGIG